MTWLVKRLMSNVSVAEKTPVVMRPPATAMPIFKWLRSRAGFSSATMTGTINSLRREAAVEELAPTTGAEDRQAARHDEVEVARHAAGGERYAHRGLVRDAAAADEHTPLGGSDSARRGVDGALCAEALAERNETVVGGDDYAIDTAAGEATGHVEQQVDDRLEVRPGDRQQPGFTRGIDLLGSDQHQVRISEGCGEFLLALLGRLVEIKISHLAMPCPEQVAAVLDGAHHLAGDAHPQLVAFEVEPQPRSPHRAAGSPFPPR